MIEAQEKIRALFYSNVTDENHRFEFDLFNVSVTQKLWSTEQDYKELVGLDINDFQEPPYVLDTKSDDIAGSKTQSISTMTSQTRPVNIQEYCRHLNRLLDGFFMNSLSALDALAHQISALYDLDNTSDDIYITSIAGMLRPLHPNSKAQRFLLEQIQEDWFKQYKLFRVCTTHESLIGSDITLRVDQSIPGYRQPKTVLPDEPKVRPFTYAKDLEVTKYCQSTLGKIQALITGVYDNILVDISEANNILPIPRTRL